ncbi:hypothetical protein LL912_18110 [Niabella sp. CC-SYL272]|uniref:hypothetical protein n=1 Tax=Niabella agricola TaxID=2891571 RepID=UPI001F3B4696|nr:hypothetical protein [Niabella agricola]MCF3110703.1 hypothetical protein [Niabella agricola]
MKRKLLLWTTAAVLIFASCQKKQDQELKPDIEKIYTSKIPEIDLGIQLKAGTPPGEWVAIKISDNYQFVDATSTYVPETGKRYFNFWCDTKSSATESYMVYGNIDSTFRNLEINYQKKERIKYCLL